MRNRFDEDEELRGSQKPETNYRASSNINHPAGSGKGAGILAILIAMIFIVGPLATPEKFIPAMTKVILVGFGVLLLVVGSIIITITKLYIRSSSSQSFVRTGMGGPKAIIDGGAIVVPLVHQVTPVSLETMRLDVERKGTDALITGDNLRADVAAEFYIKVKKEPQQVIAAATSLGTRSCNPGLVKELVQEKLISALRTVGSTKRLDELHTKRDEFAEAVHGIVGKDLESNGLTLESVTISKLDQTPTDDLKADKNVFDAQGARTIAEIIQNQRVQRNQIERDADQKVAEQDVKKDQFVFQQDVLKAKAAAEKDFEIKQAQASADQKAKSFTADQERLAQLAKVEQDKAVQVAEVEKTQAINVKEQERQQAEREAEIKKNRQLEIAERDKEIAVAGKEKERADAEALRLDAEKKKEAASQAVQTTTVTAQAERDKSKAIIDQQAASERDFIKAQKAADANAYSMQKEAEGKKAAAEAEFDATVKAAEGQQKSKESNAAGLRAEQMVPVEVAAKQVEVDQAKVQVLQTELAAKSEHAAISKELEIALATINADKEARIAFAKALGEGLSNANMTIWGDPDTVGKISRAFTNGQMAGNFMTGLTESTPERIQDAAMDVKDGVTGMMKGLGGGLGGLIQKLTGVDVSTLSSEEQALLAKLVGKFSGHTEVEATTTVMTRK
jgi:uncharacterized membrane protein YqiK